MEEARRGRKVRALLFYIAVASVFQVVFLNTEIPLIRDLAGKAVARGSGMVVLSTVITGLIVFALVVMAQSVWTTRVRVLGVLKKRREVITKCSQLYVGWFKRILKR